MNTEYRLLVRSIAEKVRLPKPVGDDWYVHNPNCNTVVLGDSTIFSCGLEVERGRKLVGCLQSLIGDEDVIGHANIQDGDRFTQHYLTNGGQVLRVEGIRALILDDQATEELITRIG